MSYQADDQVLTLLKALRSDAALLARLLHDQAQRLTRLETQLIELHATITRDEATDGRG